MRHIKATLAFVLVVQCITSVGQEEPVKKGLVLGKGVCIVQGTTSPPENKYYKPMFRPFRKGAPSAAKVRVHDSKEVLSWCRKRVLEIKDKLSPKCNGLVLGGHAGGGGVTDFLSCQCSDDGNSLSFLEGGKKGASRFDKIFRCFKKVLKTGTKISVASCAGAYSSGSLCAHHIASTYKLTVETSGGYCRSGPRHYATSKAWPIWRPNTKKPSKKCMDLEARMQSITQALEGEAHVREITDAIEARTDH